MASAIIHIAVANEVNKKVHRDPSQYLLGSIAPDIAKIVGIDRNTTHFKSETQQEPDIDKFLSKYKNNLDDDFVFGYYIHLFTDYFWFKYFYTEFVDDNIVTTLDNNKIRLTKKELEKFIYNDYTNMNIKLIDEYELELRIFYNEIPEIKQIISEIPMDKLDVLRDKMALIIQNSEEKKDYLFNVDNVKRFISLTTDLIIGILSDKKE